MDSRVSFDVLDIMGDSKFAWDPNSSDEVEAAKRTFEDLQSKGYRFFVARFGGILKSKEVGSFDKMQKCLIASKPAFLAKEQPKVTQVHQVKTRQVSIIATPAVKGGYPVEEVSV